ncbi:hypothetical protein BDF20DRAFT_909346 [Mycotypha africana]|uniref:uncharacterized protein n=1 Tax=Mycotypha africana TaxID=64632 RepID=UPI00230073CE|nr:uncharacterized protein BDF20DRAFT_909346 [Mycotypha africana]KAI8991586.1 hypothetical protein BDF20DRAFT_909346 [Mycotypha africana]
MALVLKHLARVLLNVGPRLIQVAQELRSESQHITIPRPPTAQYQHQNTTRFVRGLNLISHYTSSVISSIEADAQSQHAATPQAGSGLNAPTIIIDATLPLFLAIDILIATTSNKDKTKKKQNRNTDFRRKSRHEEDSSSSAISTTASGRNTGLKRSHQGTNPSRYGNSSDSGSTSSRNASKKAKHERKKYMKGKSTQRSKDHSSKGDSYGRGL